MIMAPNLKNTKERTQTNNTIIKKISPSTLVVGIDIAKDKHLARAQDDRGIEFGKRLFFENRINDFEMLLNWVKKHQQENKKRMLFLA